MNVLLLSAPLYNYYRSVEKALIKSNCTVTTNVYPASAWYFKIPFFGIFIQKALYKLISKTHLKALYKNENQYDIIIFFSYYLLSPEQISDIKKRLNVKVLFWAFDSIYSKKNGYQILTSCDYIFTYNKEDEEHLLAKGYKAKFLPLCYDEEEYFPIEGLEYVYDIYFIGALRSRIDFLEEYLSKLNTKYKVRIDGKLNLLFILRNKTKYPNFFKYYTGRKLSAKHINLLYNQSRICLNIQPKQATSGFSIRTFEIYGAKGIQLTNGNQELLSSLFNYNSNIIYFFSNINRLVTLSNEILKNPKSHTSNRQEIITSEDDTHTFYNRIQTILSTLNSH